jgi:5'-3' exonuclease
MFNSINKVWRDFKGSHVVVCLEGKSWRKEVDTTYKANRTAARMALSPKEAEEEKLFWQAFDELKDYLSAKSNCTILQHPRCEADDFIARFIQNHPEDQHVIVSSDSDFFQLLAPNVRQFNGINKQLTTIDGIFDEKGRRVKELINEIGGANGTLRACLCSGTDAFVADILARIKIPRSARLTQSIHETVYSHSCSELSDKEKNSSKLA